MHEIHVAFRAWAAQYDDPTFNGRNRAWHEAWLAQQAVPVVKVDGASSTKTIAEQVIAGVALLAQ
ncbi:hypothetical protein D3C81_2224770 [compost metagenome]